MVMVDLLVRTGWQWVGGGRSDGRLWFGRLWFRRLWFGRTGGCGSGGYRTGSGLVVRSRRRKAQEPPGGVPPGGSGAFLRC